MKTKFTVLFLICVFSLGNLVYARPNPDCEKMEPCPDGKPNKEMMKNMHEKHLDRLAEDLKLTEEQKNQIDQILKSGWEEMKSKKEKFRQEMKELRDQKDEKIKEILSDEQKIKFDEIRKKMEENMKKRFEEGKEDKKFRKDKKGKKMKRDNMPGPNEMDM